jgi:Tfp pilus assembly protein PilX
MAIEAYMKKNPSDLCNRFIPGGRTSHRPAERGVALVFTLLIVAMVMVLSLGMVIALSAQTFIGGYYRNFRGSFYAADSGLTVARQALVNQVTLAVSPTFSNPPIANPSAVAASILATMNATYGSSTSLNNGSAAGSWAESFKILPTATFVLAPNSPTITGYDSTTNCQALKGPSDPTGACPTGYAYVYNYSLTSVGSALGSEQSVVTENGSVTLGVTGQAATTNVNFAYFGGFVDQWPPCTLGWLTPGTMTGPMFTNSAWEFGGGGSAPYIFTDPVGQVNPKADYWDGSGCHQSATSTWGSGGNTIAPTFQEGFNLGQPAVPLPNNAFSQEWAVVDGNGSTARDVAGAPADSDLNANLKSISGAAYPAGGAGSGVFFNYSCLGSPCTNTFTGGGFLVEGNATVQLVPVGASAQKYTITSGGVTTIITVDPVANTTVVSSGGTTLNLTGVPTNSLTNPPQAATMVYVDGSITSLSGPGEGLGAIQDNSMITLTAKGDVTATGDVLYKTEPVTYAQDQVVPGSNPPCCIGMPMDSLIPGVANMNQVLGIFSATGNFDLNTNQPDHNVQVDGTIALISAGGCGGFLDTGPWLNTFNNVGGQTQNCIYGAAINVENVWFDRRYTARSGFAPPWFPGTTITQGGPLPTNVTTSVQRIQWLNNSAM